MDILTAILTCSLYLADDDLVRAIAESTSESNPYFVMDASADLTQVDPPPRTKSAGEAAARATDILAKGGRPLLGLLLAPPAWMAAFGRDLAAAFDPCTNLAVGSAMLSEFDVECSGRGDRARAHSSPAATMRGVPPAAHRQCVLHKYEDAIGHPDFALTTTLELRYQRLARPPVESAPIFWPAPSAHWGPDQLLVSASFLPMASPEPSDP